MIEQILYLVKERARLVVFFAITHGVPFIAPPTVITVNGEGTSHVVNRKKRFVAQVTFSLVKISFIAKNHTPLISTFGTKSGLGNFYFVVKSPIRIRYLEAVAAVDANFHAQYIVQLAQLFKPEICNVPRLLLGLPPIFNFNI